MSAAARVVLTGTLQNGCPVHPPRVAADDQRFSEPGPPGRAWREGQCPLVPGGARLSETPQRPRGAPSLWRASHLCSFCGWTRVGGITGQRPPPVPCSPPLPQALIVVYAFHFPHLLNPQMERSAHRGLYRRHILGLVLRGPALCFVAAGFSLFFYPLVSGGGRGRGRGTALLSRCPRGVGAELCRGLRGHWHVAWCPGCQGAKLEGKPPPHPSPPTPHRDLLCGWPGTTVKARPR